MPFIRPYWGRGEFHIARGVDPTASEAKHRELEVRFRETLHVEDSAVAIFTGSGRTAFELILKVLKSKFPDRDEVLLPSYGCWGTFEPVLRAGLKPSFVDIGEDLNPDPLDMLATASDRSLAALTVNLCGRSMDISGIRDVFREREIYIIDDNCQNAGGTAGSSRADFAIYSFGIGKNLMATGGGCAVANVFGRDVELEAMRLTPDPSAKQRFALFARRFFGFPWRTLLGVNPPETPRSLLTHLCYTSLSPMDAALVTQQLGVLNDIIARRQANAAHLLELVREFPTVFTHVFSDNHIYTKLSLLLPSPGARDKFAAFMADRGIELESMYTPLHMRPEGRAFARQLPATESIFARVINVPVRPNLTPRQLSHVARAMREFALIWTRTHG